MLPSPATNRWLSSSGLISPRRCARCAASHAGVKSAEYAALKGVLWVVRHNHRDLTPPERQQLRLLFHYAPRLHAAYTLREELTAIFELPLTKTQARRRLQQWMQKVRQHKLDCFNAFLTTLQNWFEYIVNYFAQRRTSGFVEGLNNKVKCIKRRCYGILKVTTLFQRLTLDLEGYRLFA